jgi:hypothetical protein
MPNLSASTELVPLSDDHIVKFGGANAVAAARAFYKLPLELPKGEYFVKMESGELQIYGIKSGIRKSKCAGADVEYGDDGPEYTLAGNAKIVVHANSTAEASDLKGGFALVKKLLPVVDAIAEVHKLKAKIVAGYGPKDAEREAADKSRMSDLLRKIQEANKAPAATAPTTPAATTSAPVRPPKTTPTPKPTTPRPAPSSSWSSPPTSSFSRSSG